MFAYNSKIFPAGVYYFRKQNEWEKRQRGGKHLHPAEHQITSECRSKPWATAGGEIARLLPHLSELTSLPGPRPTSFSYRLLLVNLVGSLTSNCHLLFRSPLWSDSSPATILPLDRLAPSLWWAVWGCLCLSSAQWHRGCFSTLPPDIAVEEKCKSMPALRR